MSNLNVIFVCSGELDTKTTYICGHCFDKTNNKD
jgi:hypothetical protein